MIEIVIVTALALYFLIGLFCWYGGIKTFGGRKNYILYITKEKDNLPIHNVYVLYYTAFLIFIFTWPFFIRRNKNE